MGVSIYEPIRSLTYTPTSRIAQHIRNIVRPDSSQVSWLLRCLVTNTDIESFKILTNKCFYRLLRRSYPPVFLLPVFNRINFTQRHERLLTKRNTKTPTRVVFLREQHPIGERPQVKAELKQVLVDQPIGVSNVVSRYLPPLAAFKKGRTLGSHLVRAAFRQDNPS